MKLYRFSPINDEATCWAALAHIQTGMRELSKLVLAEDMPIYTLKLFAHYIDEYEYLLDWINKQGEKDDASSATSYYVKPNEPIMINNESIGYLGLRVPDPHRAQVGCGDFVIKDYAHFKRAYLGKSPFIREVEHPVYEMLELWHPDVDVLGYIVKE